MAILLATAKAPLNKHGIPYKGFPSIKVPFWGFPIVRLVDFFPVHVGVPLFMERHMVLKRQ